MICLDTSHSIRMQVRSVNDTHDLTQCQISALRTEQLIDCLEALEVDIHNGKIMVYGRIPQNGSCLSDKAISVQLSGQMILF